MLGVPQASTTINHYIVTTLTNNSKRSDSKTGKANTRTTINCVNSFFFFYFTLPYFGSLERFVCCACLLEASQQSTAIINNQQHFTSINNLSLQSTVNEHKQQHTEQMCGWGIHFALCCCLIFLVLVFVGFCLHACVLGASQQSTGIRPSPLKQ